LSKIFLPNFSNRPSTTVAVSRTRCKERKIQVSRILVPKSTGISDFALLITSVQVQPRNNSEKLLISKISATDQLQMMLYQEKENIYVYC
jgi:hypothetical protein